jgi:hypothetical protein
MKEITFQVALNQKYRDKVKPGDGRFWDFNMTFQNSRLTLPKLLNAIRAGYAWTAPHRRRQHRPTAANPHYHTTYRVKEIVISSQLLALDSDTGDERSHFETLLGDTFIGQYAALLHATASSTPDAPRTRVIFLLEKPLAPAEYEQALRVLLHRYPFCDQSVNHAAVVFYGARDCSFHPTGNILPLDALETQLLQPFAAFLENERQQREAARQARLAAYGSREQPAPEQAARYVAALYEKRLAELAATEPGSGLRHRRLYTAAITIGSLQSAAWLPAPARARLDGAAHDLLLAAETNGYVADYGEDDAWLTISNGLAQGTIRPREEPVWYAERPFFQVGDPIKATVRGQVKAVGRVARLRETTHWEYELGTLPNVWFARPLLDPAGDMAAG